MNVLREARKRLFERRWYGGRAESEEYIEDQYNRWNNQPPTRMHYCDRCGSEVRWFRETPQFSVKTGKPGHSYHLKCPHAHDYQYELDRSPELADHPKRFDLIYNQSQMHYDPGEYRFREDDRESFDQEDLW